MATRVRTNGPRAIGHLGRDVSVALRVRDAPELRWRRRVATLAAFATAELDVRSLVQLGVIRHRRVRRGRACLTCLLAASLQLAMVPVAFGRGRRAGEVG